jgi:hypothetical protein
MAADEAGRGARIKSLKRFLGGNAAASGHDPYSLLLPALRTHVYRDRS